MTEVPTGRTDPLADFLCQTSPISVWAMFSYEREEAIVGKLTHSASNSPAGLPRIAFFPVNPLLLASVIALSILRSEDFGGLVARYRAGEELPGLELLFRLPELPPLDTNHFLVWENKYV